MNSTPETIPINRYIALDLHKHYIMVGGQNRDQEWVLRPRKVQMHRFRDWAAQNLKSGNAVILETTANVWDIYDIVVPLVTKAAVAHAGKVRQIAEARIKTDTEDIKRLILLLIADIVPDTPKSGARREAGEALPEVWVPPMHVRELRSLISFRLEIIAHLEAQRARIDQKLAELSDTDPWADDMAI